MPVWLWRVKGFLGRGRSLFWGKWDLKQFYSYLIRKLLIFHYRFKDCKCSPLMSMLWHWAFGRALGLSLICLLCLWIKSQQPNPLVQVVRYQIIKPLNHMQADGIDLLTSNHRRLFVYSIKRYSLHRKLLSCSFTWKNGCGLNPKTSLSSSSEWGGRRRRPPKSEKLMLRGLDGTGEALSLRRKKCLSPVGQTPSCLLQWHSLIIPSVSYQGGCGTETSDQKVSGSVLRFGRDTGPHIVSGGLGSAWHAALPPSACDRWQ